jgi:hypothetical protein
MEHSLGNDWIIKLLISRNGSDSVFFDPSNGEETVAICCGSALEIFSQPLNCMLFVLQCGLVATRRLSENRAFKFYNTICCVLEITN